MAWRKATEDDLKRSISETEVEAYREAANDSGDDRITELLTRTTRLVRGYLRANRRIRLPSDELLIPDTLIAPAMDYAAFDVVAVVPVDNMEDRRSRRRDAIRVFEQVASDQFYVESAEPADESASGAGCTVVTQSHRRVTPESLEGL